MNPGTGAHTSPFDKRTWQHPADLAAPLTKGGLVYAPEDIEHQHNVGICTAACLIQNAEKATGRKYSIDFQYLLQKKYIDQAWYEGSSIFSALKAATRFGLLPIEHFSHVTEADRSLSYADYAAKLQAISDTEIERLLLLCEKVIVGYAQLATDPQSLAKGILDSRAGILTRYEVGKEWYTPSWNASDIDPLRPPKEVISGHAIGKTYFDFTVNLFTLANTWGRTWNTNGNGHTNPSVYSCTEAWIPYYGELPAFRFTRNLCIGMKSEDVRQLQIRLGGVPTTAFFGTLTFAAVRAYQQANGIPATGFVGPLTRAKLNGSA